MDVKCATCKHSAEMNTKKSCICRNCLDYEYYEPDESIKQMEIAKIKQLDFVNHPPHYQACSIECFDIMYMMFGAEAVYHYCVINAYKYMHRHKNKNGHEDLEKAEWYLNKADELEKKSNVPIIEHDRMCELWEVFGKLKEEYKNEENES